MGLFSPNPMFLFGGIGWYQRRGFLTLSRRPRVASTLLCPVFLARLGQCRTDTGIRSQRLLVDRVAVVVGITMILAAVSLPWVRGTRQNYNLCSAIATATGVIQTTRYQAIMKGCAYQVTFNSSNVTYQVVSAAQSGTVPVGTDLVSSTIVNNATSYITST